MYTTRGELKRYARERMERTRPAPALVTLIYTLISGALQAVVPAAALLMVGYGNLDYWMSRGHGLYEILFAYLGGGGASALTFGSVLVGLLTQILMFGYLSYTLKVLRSADAGVGSLGDGLALAGKIILLQLVSGVFIFLWSLLLIIPGIVASYRYRMAPYVLLDNPDCGVMEALRVSKELMRGHKAELFVFDLSFLPWLLLQAVGTLASELLSLAGVPMLLSLGAAWVLSALVGLWVTPYYYVSQSAFYTNLTGGGYRFLGGDNSWDWRGDN